MKRKRFSVEQIVAVLKQAELGMRVADIIRKVGISEQTFYRWKKQYAGLQSDRVRELKVLQDENARLKNSRRQSPTSAQAAPSRSCGRASSISVSSASRCAGC